MNEVSTADRPASQAARRGPLALASLAVLGLAPMSWLWLVDQPFMRRTALSAWVLLALALVMGLAAARVDRRGWIRAIAVFQFAAVGLYTWAFFGYSALPTVDRGRYRSGRRFHLARPRGGARALGGRVDRGPRAARLLPRALVNHLS